MKKGEYYINTRIRDKYMFNKTIINNLVKQCSEKRGEIIDNFLKMFVASRIDWFKEKPERMRRIKLIEERSENGLKTTYRIEMMTGKKKIIK